MPLSHRPGHAQVDFGETLGVIGGVECKIHFFVMSLPHSDAVFVKGYPAETTEAFCDGQSDTLLGHNKAIGERLTSDLDALMGLPSAEYEACDHVSTRATSISMVRYKSNDYSVPVTYAHHDAHVRGFVHEVIRLWQ